MSVLSLSCGWIGQNIYSTWKRDSFYHILPGWDMLLQTHKYTPTYTACANPQW